ncbi:glycosyltransferase involved in cell wall biosynthesis [Streptomyces canus]|uniref:D-inositol 3-phosphate glycosyltransferase n=1 Tax=Streptomyces canus TaxID=58343 RepID=A0AAW8FIV4_9ACTN|nr:glycosyltransferase involved in cell wall biosynthesis [Streptomyces canus]
MGRAAEFFTPVLENNCHVTAVVSLSADRAGSDRFKASWDAKVRAAAAVLGQCATLLAVRTPEAFYLPIAQWGLALLRDCLVVTLGRVAGCTPVLHLHGAQLPSRLSASRGLRAVLADAHWIVLSEAVAEQLRASGCRTRSVTVIRNPAPPASTFPQTRPTGPSLTLRVGWLGTVCRAKGFDVLCGAVERLKSQGADVEFRVAGMRLDVPASAMACVDEDFGVLDPADVPAFWAEVDVFVLPARWAEGLPFVLLEGLQAGCAVAATPSPGCAELFGQGCVEPVEATVDSVAGFLKACGDDLAEIRGRQQKAWEELRPRYEPGRVEEAFVRFWRNAAVRLR